jgi:hypothetical protein
MRAADSSYFGQAPKAIFSVFIQIQEKLSSLVSEGFLPGMGRLWLLNFLR